MESYHGISNTELMEPDHNRVTPTYVKPDINLMEDTSYCLETLTQKL